MKRISAFMLFVFAFFCASAQQNLGIRNGNYAGIQGALLNPASIASSKLKWDVNVLSVGEIFDNTFLYAPKSSLSFFGIRKIIKGSIDENLFRTHFDPQQPDKLYNLTFATEFLGPSFFLKIKKKHSIGFTVSARSYANIKNIPGNVAQNFFDYFKNRDLWSGDFHDQHSSINTMSWLQYGLHYATEIYSNDRNKLEAGVSLNYLQGVAAAYYKNTNINYNIADTANFLFTSSSFDYGRTNFNDFEGGFHGITHGHGFGADMGVIYMHLDNDKNNYIYKIGISIIDIGAIRFNRDAASYHIEAQHANFEHWYNLKFTENTQFDRALSAVFYDGDSSQSLRGTSFKMGLPAALSIQGDWNVYKNYFLNATIIKGFGHGRGQGVTRADIYSITPRYESKWWDVSLPISLLYYGHLQSRMGIAVRAGYFFIGGDAPGALLKLNNLEGVDFYAGIHFFIAEKK